jgi:hypothetical protein
MNAAAAVRQRIDDLRLRLAVARLNSHAAAFGFPPRTQEEWIAGLARLAPAVRTCGVDLEDLSRVMSQLRDATLLDR